MIDIQAVRDAFPEIERIEPLSDGGQKLVFSGHTGNVAIALKLIKPGQNPERLRRELKAAETLDCDYVPQTIDSGERLIGEETFVFVVERFVEGRTYRDILQRQGATDVGRALSIAIQLVDACCDFESAKLVHRDIKPENLIVDKNGKIWILDFGIVRFLDMESATPSDWGRGPSTVGYGAPEQLRNLKGNIDSRSDLYAIGLVLYETISGSNPYLVDAQHQLDVRHRQLTQDLPLLEIDGDTEDGIVAQFLASLCSRFPSRRPRTAIEAKEWLAEIMEKRATDSSHEDR